MNKKAQVGTTGNSGGSEKCDGRPMGRDLLLVKIIFALVGISMVLAYSLDPSRAQRSHDPNGGLRQQQSDLQISENAKQMMERREASTLTPEAPSDAIWPIRT